MSIFKNRTVIGVICILLALVICFGITPLFNQSISQKAEIVRVTKDIHAGELITRDMVATAEVGSYNLPSGLMTAKDNVVGKYAKANLAVGDYILAAKLHLSLVYRGTADGAKQFIEAQDELIEELYAEPEEESSAESENADSVAAKRDNEVME